MYVSTMAKKHAHTKHQLIVHVKTMVSVYVYQALMLHAAVHMASVVSYVKTETHVHQIRA